MDFEGFQHFMNTYLEAQVDTINLAKDVPREASAAPVRPAPAMRPSRGYSVGGGEASTVYASEINRLHYNS